MKLWRWLLVVSAFLVGSALGNHLAHLETVRAQILQSDSQKVLVGRVVYQGVKYAALPASPDTGSVLLVTDSTTVTLHAAVTTGGGSNVVLAAFNGTNWLVIANCT